MWDSALYAMNLFYYHWLVNKVVSTNGLVEQSQAGNLNRDMYGEKVELERRHLLPKEEDLKSYW